MEKQVIHGVIVDCCKTCSGVWLDGGELDLVGKAIRAGAGSDWSSGFVMGIAMGFGSSHGSSNT
jgi:Zn-finger nucleic acid-binding protein